MKKIRDMLLSEETLFRNEDIFSPDHVPEVFNHRDSQLKALAGFLKPTLKGSRGINSLIYGPPATGKTTAVKLIFEKLGEESDRVVTVHINCQIYSSSFRIFAEIHKKLFGFLPAETGIPLSNIYDKIFKKLAKEKKNLVVALDDMNYLFLSRDGNKILYDLLRAHEAHPGARTTVWGIMPSPTHKIEDKVRSIFSPAEIEFPLYRRSEIYDIIKNRAELGFYPGVIKQDILEMIVDSTADRNDLRFGIELLKKAGLEAENDASKEIKIKHLKKALGIKEELRNLDKNEKTIIEIISNTKNMESGKLYKEFCKKSKLSYTTFYRILERMETKRIITMEDIKKKRGRTRIIRFIE